jgi:hypothetical protein
MNSSPLNATADPLRAIMRSFEFNCVVTTVPARRSAVVAAARRARPSASPKSKIENRKF